MSAPAAIPPQPQNAAPPTSPPTELPRVSVIIPVRNDAQRLARCLDSLAAQSYPADRFEVIVVDNGSTDGSAEVASSRGAKVLHHPALRVGALRNRGVEAASGAILAFVDSDHETPRDWLTLAIAELAAGDGVLMAGSPCLADPRGTWVQRTWEIHRTRGQRRRAADWLGAGNMFLWRRDFLHVGGFDENLVAAEDVDLCVRLSTLPGAILSDLRLANVHHGEPRTLWDFVKKEYWRGSSGLAAFLGHGMPLHELPSLLFPLYHLLVLAGVTVMVFLTAFGLSWIWPAAGLLLLLLPALMLGWKTCRQERKFAYLPALATLYLAYGLTRAWALFKR